MEEHKLKDFFNNFNKFKKIRDKEKANGKNDYNMVNVVQKETREVEMHSNVIYSLINPDGLHYQDDLFLKKFIEIVLKPKVQKFEDFGEIIDVQAEELTSKIEENKRIDFTIKSTKYYVGIEMKINHHDSDNQLSDYLIDLKNKAESDNNQEAYIFYLTKDGKEAQERSHNNINYERVSFEEHIMNWIEGCQKEIKNTPNLQNIYESFKNYKQIVEKITNKYKGNIMKLTEYMKKNNKEMDVEFDIICDIFNEKDALLECVNNKFWTELSEKINEFENVKSKPEFDSSYAWIEFEYNNKSIKIIREYNLYIKINQEWKYVKFDGIKNQIEGSKSINMRTGNEQFWQLGKQHIRTKLVSDIVEYIKDNT